MSIASRVEGWTEFVLRDVGTIRRGVLYAVVAALSGSLLLSQWLYGYARTPSVAIIAVPLVALVAWRLRRRRAELFGLCAGGVAFGVPAAIGLWVAAAALAYLSVYEDRRPTPWWAVAPGFVGSVAGTIVALGTAPQNLTPAPYLGLLLGVGLGLLIRAMGRLEGETQVLRATSRRSQEQARWLEQRTVLARELHDVVGHHVTAMVVQAEAGLVGDPQHALTSIGDLGRSALGELDALVVHLRDPDAPLLLSAPPRLLDIDELLAAPLRQQGVAVDVRLDDGLELDEATTLTVYRIAQETLTNVARHARAQSAWVELAPASGRLRLRVTDDGVGPPATIERGAGLLGIEERVRAVEGIWMMSERPGGGTMVDVLLPLPGARR